LINDSVNWIFGYCFRNKSQAFGEIFRAIGTFIFSLIGRKLLSTFCWTG